VAIAILAVKAQCKAGLAVMLITRLTRVTASATVCNASDTHHLTDRDTFNLGTHIADNTDHLVPRHHGIHAAAKLVARGHQIGMTDSAVLQIKPHVAGAQRASFNRRFAQARARFFELVGHGHGCLLIILFVIVTR